MKHTFGWMARLISKLSHLGDDNPQPIDETPLHPQKCVWKLGFQIIPYCRRNSLQKRMPSSLFLKTHLTRFAPTMEIKIINDFQN